MNSDNCCTEEELCQIIERSPPEIQRTIRMFIRQNEKVLPKQKKAQIFMFKKFLKTSNFEEYPKKILSLAFNCSKTLITKVWKKDIEEQDGIQKKSGAPKKLNEYETQELIDWVQKKFNDGDPPQRYEIMMKARRILMKNGKVDKLSKNWVESFIEQNNERIKKVKASPMEELRYQVGIETVIEWFDLLKEKKLCDIEPGLIINIDETGFGSSNTKNLVKKTVIVPENINRSVFYQIPRQKKHISAILSITADGSMLKPGIIGINKNLPLDANRTTFYNNIYYYSSEKAFISKKIFGDYINCEVIPYIENERRRIGKLDARAIILVDGHLSHHDELLEAIFAEKNIFYAFIPPHSSHILQPLDRCLFSVLKNHYGNKRKNKNLISFTSKLENIYISIQESQITSHILKSFSRSGIKPDLLDGVINKVEVCPENLIEEFFGNDNNQEIESDSSSDEVIGNKNIHRNPAKNASWGIMNQSQFEKMNQGLCPLCGKKVESN